MQILFVKRASLCLAGGFGISLNLSSLTGRDPHKLACSFEGGWEGGMDESSAQIQA